MSSGKSFQFTLFCALLISVIAAGHAISSDDIDPTKVFFGDPSSFENPAEVDLDQVIMATDEYREIEKKKIKKGTGKYWELMCKATDRAISVVLAIGSDGNFDLICAAGYLSACDPPIEAEDATDLAISKL